MTSTADTLYNPAKSQVCITAPNEMAICQTDESILSKQKPSPKQHLRTVSSTRVIQGRKIPSLSGATARNTALPVQLELAVAENETALLPHCDTIAVIEGAYTPYCCGIGVSQIDELNSLIVSYALVKRLSEDAKDRLIAAAKTYALITIPDAVRWFQSEVDLAIDMAMTYRLRDLAIRCRDSRDRTIWLGWDIDPHKFFSMRVNPVSLPGEEECRAVSGLNVIVVYHGDTTEYSQLWELCGSLYQAKPIRLQVIDIDVGRIAHLILMQSPHADVACGDSR